MKTPITQRCPFCNGERFNFNQTCSTELGRGWWHSVVCANKRCAIRGPYRRSKASAIRAWNRRRGGPRVS